jgi:hypothetical protein
MFCIGYAMTPLIHGSLALLIAFLLFPAQQAELTGDWYFDRFGGPHGEIAKNDSIDKANKKFEGVKFTFTKDGKFRSVEQDGTHNTKAYEYIPGQRLVIVDGDSMKIMLLTAMNLELYPINGRQPTLFMKRSKEGKTVAGNP